MKNKIIELAETIKFLEKQIKEGKNVKTNEKEIEILMESLSQKELFELILYLESATEKLQE